MRDIARKINDASLACGIGENARKRSVGIHAPNIEYRTAVIILKHRFDKDLTRKHRPFQIDRHNPIPRVRVDVKKRIGGVYARAVYKHIDLARELKRRVAKLYERFATRNVDLTTNRVDSFAAKRFNRGVARRLP